jgi:hypothetical protein
MKKKFQKQTQLLRRRRCVFDSPEKRRKKLLQGPASLEITPKPYKWVLTFPVTTTYQDLSPFR